MSLSQDEINALLTGDQANEPDSVEIMSPEEIAAMLDEAADDGGLAVDSSPADDSPAAEADASDIMSPEVITAMLDETAESDGEGSAGGGDDLDALFSRYDEEMPAAAADTSDEDEVLAGKDGLLTPEEVDILGEVGNISMGAVATTMYSLLDRRVSITTPRVTVFDVQDVLAVYKIPFVVATIEYVEGITGNNLLVLKVEDTALITDILMGGTGEIELPIELNEMHLSVMSEIMNQMMGASSTSLSKLLRKPINISPPKSSQVDVGFDVKTLLGDIDMVTKISFDMEIEGLLRSELIQLIPYDVSREFAKQFMSVGMGMPSEESEKKAAPAAAVAPPPAPPPPPPAPPPPQAAAQEQQPAPEQYGAGQYQPPPPQPPYAQDPYQQIPYQQAPYPGVPYTGAPYTAAPYPPSAYPPQQPGRLVDVHPIQFQSFDAANAPVEQKGIDLVYNIPLQVTVELGKTKKEISEILEFGSGTIIVLDKIAGDPVEIVVNGKLIARGEVVVIDENYGVRITDIING